MLPEQAVLTWELEMRGLCSAQALRALNAAGLPTKVQSALSTVGSGAGALRGHSCGLRSPRRCKHMPRLTCAACQSVRLKGPSGFRVQGEKLHWLI